MKSFKFNPTQKGLRKTLKEYEEIALRYVWSVGEEGVGSGRVWEKVNKEMDPNKSISRASVIFFLNRMVDQGVIGYTTATGKGGHHRVYFPVLDERGYKKYLLKTIVESMMRDFPEETQEALTDFN